MTEHDLKTLPGYWSHVASGVKGFEVRRDDRDFQVGDTLLLREWHDLGGYSGREVRRTISYVLSGGQFGIVDGFAVLGLVETAGAA